MDKKREIDLANIIMLIIVLLLGISATIYYFYSQNENSNIESYRSGQITEIIDDEEISLDEETSFDEEIVDVDEYTFDEIIYDRKNPDEQGEILIRNKDEYIDFIHNCNLYNNYENITVSLMADIDFEGSETNPTPTFENDFKGTFNGNGHVFKNVYIENSSDISTLFLNNSGTIKKLVITGKIKGDRGAAAFVGRNYGTILQCVNYAEVSGGYKVGGICAWSGDHDITGTIEYCINFGNIIDTLPGGGGTIGYGGILGYCYNGEIYNCYSVGKLPSQDGFHRFSTSNISGWFYDKDENHRTKNCFYLSSNEVNKDSEYFNPTTSISSDTVLQFLNSDVNAFKLDDEKRFPILDMDVNIE